MNRSHPQQRAALETRVPVKDSALTWDYAHSWAMTREHLLVLAHFLRQLCRTLLFQICTDKNTCYWLPSCA